MVIITGASHGIGKYLFDRYTKSGESVRGTYRTRDCDQRLDKLDISSFEAVRDWVDQIKTKEMREITLINCAAINYNCFAHKADPSKWEEVIRTNLLGAFWLINCFLPIMREQGFGRIINFSSVVAQRGVIGTSAYSASKAALWGLAKTLAQENGGKNITINNINLGYADIGMGIDQIAAPQRELLLKSIPASRFCSPEEVYLTVSYLQTNGYINGTSIDLNGGMA